MSLAHFTDANFKKEVLESDLPVMVDFWANWCVDLKTIVSLNQREADFADKIKSGSSVLSYNGNKIIMEKIINSRTSKSSGHCKKLITESGREIKVTDDHRFYTPEGWERAEGLCIGDKVAVYPSIEYVGHTHAGKEILISEDVIRKYAFKNMRIHKYIEELQDKRLLPLRSNNPNLPILARLIGAQFSDGSLYCLSSNNYREISFCVGQICDVEELRHDLRSLGFESTYKKKISNCNIGGRSFVMHSYDVRSRSTSLWLLLQALGAPVGNKTNAAYDVPGWLMKAGDGLKREFLAGYIGGDGPKVDIQLSKRKHKEPVNNLVINDIEFHKRTDLEKSGLRLAYQLSSLLSQFGVKVNKIFSEEDHYKRRDNSKVRIIHICISSNFKSGYNLCQRIGYVYANQKSSNAKFVGEFLKRRLFARQLCISGYKDARSLFIKERISIKEIASRLAISKDTVFGWLRYNKKPTVFKNFEKYPAWLREAKRGLKDGFLWEKIHRIEQVYLSKVQSLSVENEHNFIANGFLVHNCGPCKMIAPFVEEAAAEYKGKVKIGKVDVDQNPKTASGYGIMSIPTLVFFKDGKVMAQVSGAINRAELKKRIEENI